MRASPVYFGLLGLGLALVSVFLFVFLGDEETDVVSSSSSSEAVGTERFHDGVRRNPRPNEERPSSPPGLGGPGKRPDAPSVPPSEKKRVPPAITGRVLSKESGQPIAGARVGLMHSAVVESFMSLDLSRLLRTVQAPNRPITVATTDDDGVFQMPRVAPGDYAVLVRADGYGRRFSDSFRLPKGGEITGLEVRLGPAVSFSGLVRNVEGLPVPNVRVSLFDRGREQLRVLRTYQTTTNAEGRFAFHDLEPGRYNGSLMAEGYGATGMGRLRLKAGEDPPEPKEYTLFPEAEVIGRVFDVTSGKGLEGALVYAMAEFEGGRGFPAYVETRSGKDGAYSLRGLSREADVILGARKEGYSLKMAQSKGSSGIPGIELKSKDRNGERDLVDLPMVGGATVMGRVLADGSLEPVVGAKVTLISPNGIGTVARTGPVVTDENGRYEFNGVPAGAFMVLASHPDFVRSVSGLKAGFLGDFMSTRKEQDARRRDLQPGEVRDAIDVVMQKGARVSGKVIDGKGAPVAGATVEFASKEGTSAMVRSVLGPVAPTQTDPDGRFQLVSVPRDTRVDVVARHPRFVSSDRKTLNLSGDAAPPKLVLHLGQGAVFEGVAYDGDGRVLPKTLVELRPTERRGGGFLGLPSTARPTHELAARTDDAGRFRIDRIPAAKYVAILKGKRVRRIEFAAGEKRSEDLRLVRQVTIEGFTVYEDGSPFPGAVITAKRIRDGGNSGASVGPAGKNTAVSDELGRFQLTVAEGGTYALKAGLTRWERGPDGRKRPTKWSITGPPRTVVAGEKGVRFVLGRQ